MWLSDTSAAQRRTLVAGFLGYGVDGFDFMVYTFVVPTLLVAWSMTKAEAGTIATVSLLTSAVGGWAAGAAADRFGRLPVLQLTVAWFAVLTFVSGFTHSYGELLLTRALQGFGFGGEWSVGSLLVAESVDARHRGRAAGLVQSSWAVGWAAAAAAFWGIYSVVPAATGWKILFWIGILPALLIVYVRRHVEESPVFIANRAGRVAQRAGGFAGIFGPDLRKTTVLASLACGGMMSAYYSVTIWLPTYLKTERHLSVTGTSGYLLVLIGGSFAGYLTSAWLSDMLGRRRCFVIFAACALLLTVAYMGVPISDNEMLVLGFPLGFCLSGVFAGTGAFLSELYPTMVRGSGQGFAYNVGRAVGAGCPALIGVLSTRFPLGLLIGSVTAVAYAVVIASVWALPETRGRSLVSPDRDRSR